MKVLWFTNIPMPAMLNKDPSGHSGSGGWMLSLLDALKQRPGIQLGVSCVSAGLRNESFEEDGINYFPIPHSHRSIFKFRNPDQRPGFLSACEKVIKEYCPDIIHVHGTERPYGLIGLLKKAEIPVVISIQGLLSKCCTWHNTFGDMPFFDLIKMHRPSKIIRGIGPLWDFWHLRCNAKREQKIIRFNKYFFGRTDWDRSHVFAHNPEAQYFHVNELLRPEFYRSKWQLSACRRHSIIYTNSTSPRRGLATLFRAVTLIKRQYPDVLVQIAGVDDLQGEYGQYLSRLMHKEGICDNIEFLGQLNAAEICQALTSNHVFVLPSLIENSPNSLCEAQTVGMPCVATYTGGVPSLIESWQSGLLAPVEDEALMAQLISNIFSSDDLAVRLGSQARELATWRHNPRRVLDQLIGAYKAAIKDSKRQ